MKNGFVVLLVSLLGLAGCRTSERAVATARGAVEKGKADVDLPMVYSVGNGAILTFKKNAPLNIPVDGQNLSDKRYDISVFLKGVTPLTPDKDFMLDRTNRNNQAVIRISPAYFTDEVKSRDTLSVEVRVSRKSRAEYQKLIDELSRIQNSGGNENDRREKFRNFAAQHSLQAFENAPTGTTPTPDDLAERMKKEVEELKKEAATYGESISTASRIFVLYEATDYREKFLASRVDVPDINAFPLPSEETKNLFGSYVEENFYVVKLSMRNTRDEDVLVSTGLIKAYGRALVRPSGERGKLSFTVPIEVAPQSREHVYAMVQTQREFKTRQWVFRSLDFAGALAGAMSVAYGGPGLVKGTELATSVGIPGLRALWPDTVPNQLQNIVNFAMGDLVKVPKKTVSLHKYLFFSKGDLQAAIPDPLMLGEKRILQRQVNSLPAGVAFLSFDTLEIPYENVITSPQDSTERRMSRLLMRNQELRQKYAVLRETWIAPGDADKKLFGTALADVNSLISEAQLAETALAGQPASADRDAGMANVKALRQLLERTRPGMLLQNLLGSPEFGELALLSMNAELERVRGSLLNGLAGELFDSQLRTIEDRFNIIESALGYAEEISKAVKNADLAAAVQKLKTSSAAAEIQAATKTVNTAVLSLMRKTEIGFLYTNVKAPTRIE